MVRDNQPKGVIHLFDGSHMLAIWRKWLLQVFRSMDSFGIHSFKCRENFRLRRNNLQTTKHLCVIGSDVEGRRSTKFLHGIVPSRCHVCKECIHGHEFKLGCCVAPGPCLLHHTMGEQVQEILCTHMRWIHHPYSFYYFQEGMPKIICSIQ